MNHPDSEVIRLNLIFDYPVRWSRFKVLRDLLQNFYDAVGHRQWRERFVWEWADERLTFKVAGVGFSYDWLLHLGASTKREHPDEYAGYFGEGFKIAALCALRDHDWRIELASRDWRLQATTAGIVVDGYALTSLAYRVWRGEPVRDETILWIHPFREGDREILECVLPSFYYEENPLFGEKLWSSSKAAVFLRSGQPKPAGYPATGECRGPGIVFAGYQALGSLEPPLVICAHQVRWNDRERNTFFKMDVVRVVRETVAELPAAAAMRVLPHFQRWWYQYPRKRYDFDSWHGVVRVLAQRIGDSPEQAALWRERYPHLLVAEPVKSTDLPAYNRRRQALDWLHQDGRRYRLVQDGFARLGYPSLEEACEAADGFSVARPPTAWERPLIALLEQTATQVFPDLLGEKPLPPCLIIKHDRAVWMGMAVCIPRNNQARNIAGWVMRHELAYVALKPGLLRIGRGSEALSTYLHELAHSFGGDRSAAFGHALTWLLETALNHAVELTQFQQAWDRYCAVEQRLKPAPSSKDL